LERQRPRWLFVAVTKDLGPARLHGMTVPFTPRPSPPRRHRLETRLLALMALLPVVAFAAGTPSSSPRPDILLITVDTLRPDALGWIGGHDATPNIDRLAAEGLRFEAAYSPIPITLPSHTSMMTGLIPRHHGVRDNGQVVPGSLKTLAERLQDLGYRTAAFVSGYPLAAEFGLEQGFEEFDGVAPVDQERSARVTTEAALSWLRGRDSRSPFFLWVHYYDPHDPYQPPVGFLRPGPRGAYLGEVAAVDASIGELTAAVSKDSKSLLTLFAGDHGESLGEHGEATHGFFVYQSTMAVPLILHYPGMILPRLGTQESALVDITPTVLDLLDIAPEDTVVFDGQSLLKDGPRARPIYLESRRPWYSYGWSPLAAVVEEGWKLIVAPRPELYDLSQDPSESINLIDRERRRARQLQGRLREVESASNVEASTVLDTETASRLAALGYVGAARQQGEIPVSGLADPKDRVELWNLLGQAETARLGQRTRQALELFDQALSSEPTNPFALSRSGALLIEIGGPENLEEGVRRLEVGVAQSPLDAEAWATLAGARGQLRRWAQSADAWQEVVRLQPRRREAWIGLANALGLSKRPKEAVLAFDGWLEIQPEDADVVVRAGFARVSSGDLAGAAKDLEAAASLQGESFQHSSVLGILLVRLGRDREAAPWLRRSRSSEADFVEGRLALARYEAEAGNLAAARRALAEAMEKEPSLPQRLAKDPFFDELLP
ncbi:MAG: sulfatase-like hydrolase/transferase, partial [Thermoanaerobaculia bacterium]|nr:sulfatase-like hydrolase/transferase [Thermoanaerobaculia bacterium]